VRGAMLTLGNRKFKHAKPSDFNDTEDLTIQSIFPEDVEAALTKLATSSTDVIVKHLNDPPTSLSLELRGKIALLQQIYRENPDAAEVIKEEIRKDTAADVYDVEHMRAKSQEHVKEINEFMQGYRILCVTTQNDSERMWAGYAQNHEGIVLRIQPNDAKDSKFRLFQPVQYRAARPPLYDDTLGFLEDSLFGDQMAKLREITDRIIYSKTLEWEYESEFRLAIPVPEGEDWNTLAYHPEEITELYLGLAMSKENKDEIVALAKAVNPNIVIFQASRGANRALTFQKF
jgi:DUF2971 family protein